VLTRLDRLIERLIERLADASIQPHAQSDTPATLEPLIGHAAVRAGKYGRPERLPRVPTVLRESFSSYGLALRQGAKDASTSAHLQARTPERTIFWASV